MRLSLMALTALTAALHLTAAAPTAAPTAKDGDFPKDMWIKKIEGDRIVADLGAGEGHSEQHWITVQTECQEIDRSPGHFPNGIEWIGMPDGYR
ncbi:hypothetical protein BDW74DRAFT_184284, partial [Aspergillus multicolor]|uniref:uncharacterized protein n=1 Tax=Aspergillus multicolor TaxID=41759 RepID=UPI003CCDF354